MEKIIGLIATLVAYSDTYLGFVLRSKMVQPIGAFDPELAAYIAAMFHF